jgi:hypothetical protein
MFIEQQAHITAVLLLTAGLLLTCLCVPLVTLLGFFCDGAVCPSTPIILARFVDTAGFKPFV